MENKQALEIAESVFAENISRRVIGGDYEERALNTIRAALEAKAVDAENAHDMIRYLLPLAKGYVAANPGIRSTETIIEDAEAMIAEAGRGKL